MAHPEQERPEVDATPPVRHLRLVVSTDRAEAGANRRASMARHPSAAQQG